MINLHPTAAAFADAFRIKCDVARAKDARARSVDSPSITIRRDSAVERRFTDISVRPCRNGHLDDERASVEMMVDQTNTKTHGARSSRKLTYANLSLDQARELAGYLLFAADEAERLLGEA